MLSVQSLSFSVAVAKTHSMLPREYEDMCEQVECYRLLLFY